MRKPYNRTKSVLLSPFISRHKSKAKVAQLPLSLQLAFAQIVLSDDGKLLFVKNPKAGCSTASHVLYEYSRGSKYTGNIHEQGAKLKRGLTHFDEALDALHNPNTVRFTFVRDPMTRALSCFKNFFVDKTNRNAAKYVRAIKNFGYSEQASTEENFSAYLNLVEASMNKSVLFTDPHFRAQVKNVAFGNINYDLICKLESYSNDLKAVFARAKIDFQGNLSGQKHNATKTSKFSPTEEMKERVYQIYSEDYKAFGYEP